MRLVREMRLYMTRKLFRYRSFNTEIINVYSNVHQKLIGIEKWKLEAFEGVVYPSSPLFSMILMIVIFACSEMHWKVYLIEKH